MQFWQQCRKNFAKIQKSFCSKSEKNIKNIYPSGNFFSSKQTIVYIRRRQCGQPCRKFSVKSPIFFCSKSKSDRKLKKISSTIFSSKCSSAQEEGSFEKRVLIFLRWKSPHLLLTSRKGSKSRKNSEKSIRMVSWISKMQFWQQCRKNFAKTQNVFWSKSGNVS